MSTRSSVLSLLIKQLTARRAAAVALTVLIGAVVAAIMDRTITLEWYVIAASFCLLLVLLEWLLALISRIAVEPEMVTSGESLSGAPVAASAVASATPQGH